MSHRLGSGTRKRTRAEISFNMSQVRSTGSEIERLLEEALLAEKLRPVKHAAMLGHPDFIFKCMKVAVFCDSHFWHGFNWKTKKREIQRNRSFWWAKISGNIRRDRLVNRRLKQDGWSVIRFWEHQILKSPKRCAARVKEMIIAARNRT